MVYFASARVIAMYARYQQMQDEIITAAVPYPKGRFAGRGVIICAGGPRFFTCAWVCIGMLRRVLGSTLPIQVWYLGPEETDQRMIALLGALDVECARWRGTPGTIGKSVQ